MSIYCLIGQSASGKSSIERVLVDRGYPRIISYTTRPMREREKNGVDYHFIDTDTFIEKREDGFFAETAEYRGWLYGLSLDGIDYQNKDYIVVVTISGYEELVHIVGVENIVAIHIHVPENERIIRQLKRGDEVDEVIRRIHTDRNDFERVLVVSQFVVHNYELLDSANRIQFIIDNMPNAKEIRSE